MTEMKTIEYTEQELVEEFAEFEDLFDKFGYLVGIENDCNKINNKLSKLSNDTCTK